MSVNAGTVYAEIALRLDKLNKGVAQAISQFHNFDVGVKKATKESENSVQKLEAHWVAAFAVISIATHKAASKVKASFLDMTNTFATFEQSLANTQSVARASAEELTAMEEAARRVGATTRSTASEAANALYYLASAGFSASESIAALDGVNALAIATQSDLAKTSEVVATTIRQYNLETEAATDIANTFTAAITNSLATMDKLAKSFEYVGPIAAGLGLSVEETTGALQLLYNKGFSGEKAGRGLRTILVNLADSTSIVNKRLARLGLTFDEVNPTVNDLGTIFDNLREHEVDATNAAAIFGKVSGVQLAALIAQSSNATGGIKELTEAVTGTNRAFEAMDIQMDTLQGSIDKFKNAEEALKIATGEGLEPTLRAIIDTATSFVSVLNKLPSNLLAAGAAIAVITTAALSASVAMTAFKVVLIQAGQYALAGAIPAFGAMALTLGGVAVAAVTVISSLSAMQKAFNKSFYDKAADDFGALAKEMGIASDKLKDFYAQANIVAHKAGRLTKKSVADVARLREEITKIAEAEGLTVAQVLAMAKANEKFVEKAGISLILLEAQIKAEEDHRKAIAEEETMLDRRYTRNRQRAIAQAELAKEEEKRVRNTAQAIAGLANAFDEAAEYTKLHGDAYDRNAVLTDAYNTALKFLIEQGLKAESKEVKELDAAYLKLQKDKGKVIAPKSDAALQIAANKNITDGLKIIAEKEAFAAKKGLEYNAAKERSALILKEIATLHENDFRTEGGAITKILKKWGKYIVTQEEKIDLIDEYKKKLDNLYKTEEEIAIAAAKGDEEKIKNIKAYYAELKKKTALEKEDKEIIAREKKTIAVVNEHTDKLEELGKSEVELLEIERARTLASIEGFKGAEKAVNDYYDAMVKDAKIKEFTDNLKNALDFVSTFSNGVTDIITDSFQRAIDAEQALLEETIANLDLQEQQALEAAGFREETKAEQLARELATAQAAYDAETDMARKAALGLVLADAQAASDKFAIEEEYREKREKAEEEANKKIATMQYKMAVAEWKNDLLQTATSGTLAVIKTFEGFGGWPWGVAPAAIMSGLAAAQLANVSANRPSPPKFADGGIVPGTSYKGDSVPAFVNSGELILNKAQQNNVAEQLLESEQPTMLYATLLIDLGNEIIERQVQAGIDDGRLTRQNGDAI